MPSHTPYNELAEDARNRRALDQIAGRQSDVERWSDPQNLDPKWNPRAQLAASLIDPPARVVDLGCGAMALEKELKPGIVYIPADLVARDLRTHVFDANAGTIPDVEADVAVALGLLEYIHDPASLIRMAGEKWPRLIISYHPVDTPAAAVNRLAKGWINALKTDDVARLLKKPVMLCRRFTRSRRGTGSSTSGSPNDQKHLPDGRHQRRRLVLFPLSLLPA